MFLALSPSLFAYPPDNAAVLYYQACLMYQPDEHMWDLLTDCVRGDVELTEEIIKHVEEHDQVIEMAVDAADVPYCDWGIPCAGKNEETCSIGSCGRENDC
jgi:hypothetical protein